MLENTDSIMEFPAGLRVLVVDDDRVCLHILDAMLRQCHYRVTTCDRATEALRILRENKDGFDVVISDVHMPDMDGFKLLELVGLEMDLPVIMMSANDKTSAVMKGIKHGACDYLLKPVRMEELKVIWQHVVRKRKEEDRQQRVIDAGWDALGAAAAAARLAAKKRKDAQQEEEEEAEVENEDPSSSSSKKPRVVWSVDLHQKFVAAVDQLGADKAVPKRILELMDVPGLTRENVASHLQKYRLYLKKLSAPPHQQSFSSASFGVIDDRFVCASPVLSDYRGHLPVKKPAIATQLLLDRASPDSHFFAHMAAIHGTNSLGSARLSSAAAANGGAQNIISAARFGVMEKSYGSNLSAVASSCIAGLEGNNVVQRLPQQSSNPLQIAGGLGMLQDGGNNGHMLLTGNNGVIANNGRAFGRSEVGIYNIPFTANVVTPSSIPRHSESNILYNDGAESNLQNSRSIFPSGAEGLASSSSSSFASRLGGASSSTDWLIADADLTSHPSASSLQIFGDRDSKLSNVSAMLPLKLENEASEPLSAAAMEDLLSGYMKQQQQQQQQQQEVLGLGLGDGDLGGEGFNSDKMYVQ